jgi:hypothetical protein
LTQHHVPVKQFINLPGQDLSLAQLAQLKSWSLAAAVPVGMEVDQMRLAAVAVQVVTCTTQPQF